MRKCEYRAVVVLVTVLIALYAGMACFEAWSAVESFRAGKYGWAALECAFAVVFCANCIPAVGVLRSAVCGRREELSDAD